MLCQICGKNPATVHFTEIHDNQMSELHVCERCAEEKGMQATAQQHKFEIADLLAGHRHHRPGRRLSRRLALGERLYGAWHQAPLFIF